jgi:hypothetical protein
MFDHVVVAPASRNAMLGDRKHLRLVLLLLVRVGVEVVVVVTQAIHILIGGTKATGVLQNAVGALQGVGGRSLERVGRRIGNGRWPMLLLLP